MREYIERLISQRQAAWHEAKRVLGTAQEAGRDLDADERSLVDNAFADIDRLDTEIKDLTAREERMREADVAREAYADLVKPEPERAPEADPVEAFFRGQAGRQLTIDLRPAASAMRAIRAGADLKELRTLVAGTAGAGGATVPTSFEAQLYQYLEANSGMRQTNARIITTSGGENLDFPKVATFGTAVAVAEGSAIGGTDATFDTLRLSAYKFGQIVSVTRELLEDTGVDIVGFVAQDLGRALGRITDNEYVNGDGTTEPGGVMTSIGTALVGGTGTAGSPTVDELIQVLYSINSNYRANGQWLMNDSTAGQIRRVTDKDGQFLWQPAVQAGEPDRLLGFPVITDTHVAAGSLNTNSVAFGDFSAFYIRDVGTISLARSEEAMFNTDSTAWRAVMRTDSGLIDDDAIKLYRGGSA